MAGSRVTAQQHVQHRGAAVAPFEPRRQRFEQPREHERQRLELLDRPLELERRLEALLGERGNERPDISAARNRLPLERTPSEPRDQISGRERRDLAGMLKVSPDGSPSFPKDVIGLNARNALFAVVVAFRSDVPPTSQRTLVLAPDAAPAGDLAAWRGLAHLPLDLPPFPALPEKAIP